MLVHGLFKFVACCSKGEGALCPRPEHVPSKGVCFSGLYLHLGVVFHPSAITSPQGMQSSQDGCGSEKTPFESSEDSGSPRASAHRAPPRQESGNKDSMGDETGEPEDHGNGFECQDGVGMGGTREETWGEDQEGDGDDGGPNSIENQEIDAVRGRGDGRVVPP